MPTDNLLPRRKPAERMSEAALQQICQNAGCIDLASRSMSLHRHQDNASRRKESDPICATTFVARSGDANFIIHTPRKNLSPTL